MSQFFTKNTKIAMSEDRYCNEKNLKSSILIILRYFSIVYFIIIVYSTL